MNSGKTAIALAFAAVLALGVVSFRQQQTNTELRGQIESLSRKSRSVPVERPATVAQAPDSGTGARVDGGADNAAELTALRAEVEQLKARIPDKVAAAAVRRVKDVDTTNLVPIADIKESGADTPEAAVSSLLSAMERNDVDALAKSITFDPATEAKIAEIYASLPQNLRRQYDSPEKLAAMLITREKDASAMQILGQETAGADSTVSVRLQLANGKTRDESYQFKQSGAGWQYVVPARITDKLDKRASAPPK